MVIKFQVDRDSTVSIDTCCRLDGPGIESRGGGGGFSAPIQTVAGAHPASYTMDTGSLPWVKRPGRGVDHWLSSSAEIKERVELYLTSISGPAWPVIGCIYFFIYESFGVAQNKNVYGAFVQRG